MLLNVFENRSVYVRSKILNIYQSMCTYNHIRLSTAFLRKTTAKVRLNDISKKVMYMYIQVGISSAILGRVICSRDDECVFIKTIKTGKGYAKIKVTEKRYVFDTPGISRCRSQHVVSVESSSLFHHSIYPWFICFRWWSIDEFENLHADRTTNYLFWVIAEAEGKTGIP